MVKLTPSEKNRVYCLVAKFHALLVQHTGSGAVPNATEAVAYVVKHLGQNAGKDVACSFTKDHYGRFSKGTVANLVKGITSPGLICNGIPIVDPVKKSKVGLGASPLTSEQMPSVDFLEKFEDNFNTKSATPFSFKTPPRLPIPVKLDFDSDYEDEDDIVTAVRTPPTQKGEGCIASGKEVA